MNKHLTVTITDGEIIKAFHAAEAAVEAVKKAARTIAISGALLLEKKAGLAHGEWMPWLDEQGIPHSSAKRHMDVARATMERLEIAHGGLFAGLTFGQCLTLPAPELPPLAQEAREKFEELVAGKTAKQMVFDWRAEKKEERKAYHPPKMTEAQRIRARNADLQEAVDHVCGTLKALQHAFSQGEGEGPTWAQLADNCVDTSKLINSAKRK